MVLLTSGTILQDRYRVERLIGQGGFGAVYEAVDLRLNRRVALKQLLRSGDRISRQFEREAQLLANLHHPSLPDVNDHFSTPDGQFLVMQYVPGDDLGTLLLERNAPFPVDTVLGWALGLLDALHYLHTRKPPIIHRDIKPQNLKLQYEGTITLLDFGLAKGSVGEAAPTIERSLMAYTMGYAPPEQVEGLGTDERSDLYALGATLYCLLTGAAPVEAQTRLLAAARGRAEPLRSAHDLNPAVPLAVSNVLTHAMQLEREDRPPSAQAMRALLAAARDGVEPPHQLADTPAPAFRAEPTLVDTPTKITTPLVTPLATARESEATVLELARSFEVPATPARPPADPATPAPARPGRSRLPLLLGGAAALLAIAVATALLFMPRGAATADALSGASEPTSAAKPTETESQAGDVNAETPESDSQAEAGGDPAEAVARHVAGAQAAFARAGGVDEAIDELQAAVELQPDNAELHSLLATAYMQRLRWDDVATEAERALELDSDSAVAYSIRSRVHSQWSEFDQALADANRAIELDPELSLGYSARSSALTAQAVENQDPEQLEAALSDADTALAAAGDQPYVKAEANAARAGALAARYRHSGDEADLQGAIEALEQATDDANLARHHAQLGDLLREAGRQDDARAALKRAIKRDPRLAGVHETLGWLLYYQREYDDAIDSFSSAIDVQQDDPSSDAYYGRGLAHHAKASLDDKNKDAELTAAYADLSEALSIGGDEQPWVWYELGLVQKESGDTSASATLGQAVNYFQARIDANPDNLHAHEGLGWAYIALEEWDAAVAAFEASIALDPQRAEAYLGKADALNGKYDVEGACQALADGLDNLPDGNQELEQTSAKWNCE